MLTALMACRRCAGPANLKEVETDEGHSGYQRHSRIAAFADDFVVVVLYPAIICVYCPHTQASCTALA